MVRVLSGEAGRAHTRVAAGVERHRDFVARREEMSHRGALRFGQLLERSEIIKNEHPTAVGAEHEIVPLLLNLQVPHRHTRYAAFQLCPVHAIVDGEKRPELRPNEQQIGLPEMFTDHLYRPTVGKVAADRGPRRTEVGAAHDIRFEVIAPVSVERSVQRARVVPRELHPTHEGGVRHTREGGRLGPRRPVVARDLNESIIGTDCQQPRPDRRFGDRGDVAELGRPLVQPQDVLCRNRTAHRQHVPIDVAREIGADRDPRVATIGTLEQMVGRDIHRASRMPRRNDRCAPVPAMPLAVFRIWLNALRLPRARVVAHDTAVLRLGIRNVVIERIRHVVESVTTGHPVPVGIGRTEGVACAARTTPRLIVLQSAVHVVERRGVVHGDRVKLRPDNVLDVVPRAATIIRNVHAAIVAEHDMFTVFRIDPERVGIAVHTTTAGEGRPGFAAVEGLLRVGVEAEDVLRIGGITANLTVVPRSAVAAVHELPRGAGVVAAIEAVGRRFRMHGGIHGVGARTAHGEANASDLTGGQAARQLRPRFCAVGGFPDGALGTARQEAVFTALPLQGRRVKHIGVGRVHHEFREARLVGDGLGVRPALAAVGGFVETTVATGRPERSHGGHVHDVGVARIDHDAADVLRFGQHRFRPRLTAVSGLEHPDAP